MLLESFLKITAQTKKAMMLNHGFGSYRGMFLTHKFMAKSPRKLMSSRSSSGEFPVSSNSAHPHSKKRLTENTINPLLKHMEYAVRGKVVLAADQISRELKSPEYLKKSKKYNFDKILYTNIGNPQSVGQAPLTWPRQVMALVNLPDSHGINHPMAKQLFPQDAIDRAREIKAGLGGHSIGAYSLSKGTLCFRKDVADFIKARDGGFEADPEDIFLTNGASTAIRMIMTALAHDPKW